MRRVLLHGFRRINKHDLPIYLGFFGVLGVFGVAAMQVGDTQTNGPTTSVWSNGWFLSGFILVVVTVVLTAVFVIAALANVPKLRLVHGEGPEFFIDAVPPTEVREWATQRGTHVTSFKHDQIRVDELRGIEAQRVQVRLAKIEPSHPVVRTPTPLLWRDGGHYGDVPAEGHAYVDFVSHVAFADGTLGLIGSIPGLTNIGEPVFLTIEAWWNGRKMASLEFAIKLEQGAASSSPPAEQEA